MKLKKVLAAALAVAMMASMAVGCGGAKDEVIKFRMNLADPETSNYYKGAKQIADNVAAATDGKIQIEVVANNGLGDERSCLELTMAGELEISTAANSVWTNFAEEMGIIDQAYLWTSKEQAHGAVDGELGKLIEARAEKMGLKVIGYMESGFRDTFSVKPIASVADFNGVKIRTMQNKYHMSAFDSFGAIATPMAYSEVYTSLQQGNIDACENAVANCLASGFYEVTKNITNTKHAFTYIIVAMSDDAWAQIPEDLQKPFLDAVKSGYESQRTFLDEANADATTELKKLGVSFYDMDLNELQALYQARAKKEGYTFEADWQAAVDAAIAAAK